MAQKTNNTTAQFAMQSDKPFTDKATPTTQSTKTKCELMFPIGCEDFEKMRSDKFYYVDKTGLIEQLLDNRTEVTLFTRPRRFGKSLNMSMLKYFFGIGSDPAFFNDLAITNRQDLCERYMGKYPVVSFTLKEVSGSNFESAFAKLCEIVQNEAIRHYYLKESDKLLPVDKRKFERLLSDNPTQKDIGSSLQTLSNLLEKHHGQKTIILIDEYDVPLDKAHVKDYYDEMVDLMRVFLGSALKTNSSLQFAVLTGCLRVSKESIFTGLNNFRVCGISDNKYTEYFGFTEPEVRKMFTDYEYEDRLDDAKKWYDGYHFGDKEIYCPWDVLNFCADLDGNHYMEPKNYWVNTSSNDIVRDLIERSADDFAQMDIETLINGGTIEKKLNLNITHREIKDNINNLWSLLYMTGYLTTTKTPSNGMFSLRIPNSEITQIYQEQIQNWFNKNLRSEAREKKEKLERFYKAFEEGDAPTVEEFLNERLLTTISFSDSREDYYHGFLTGILDARPAWSTSSNSETGHGKSDITLHSYGHKFGAVIEIKRISAKEREKLGKKLNSKLDSECKRALKQIDDLKYTAPLILDDYTNIYKYGITFCVKRCRVVCEREEV